MNGSIDLCNYSKVKLVTFAPKITPVYTLLPKDGIIGKICTKIWHSALPNEATETLDRFSKDEEISNRTMFWWMNYKNQNPSCIKTYNKDCVPYAGHIVTPYYRIEACHRKSCPCCHVNRSAKLITTILNVCKALTSNEIDYSIFVNIQNKDITNPTSWYDFACEGGLASVSYIAPSYRNRQFKWSIKSIILVDTEASKRRFWTYTNRIKFGKFSESIFRKACYSAFNFESSVLSSGQTIDKVEYGTGLGGNHVKRRFSSHGLAHGNSSTYSVYKSGHKLLNEISSDS